MRRLGKMTMAATAGGALALGLVAGPASGAPPQVSVGQVLISDTQGVIWSYDLATDELSPFADVTPGNFDIQYTGPSSVLIGNNDGFVSELDLSTLDETVLIPDLDNSRGLAVSPRMGGTYYIAQNNDGAIVTVSRGSTTPETLIEGLNDVDGNVEDLAVDKQGVVYFTAGWRLGRVDPGAEPVTAEVVATFPEAVNGLTGVVVTPTGTAYVTSVSDHGVWEVDLSTGEFTEAYAGQQLPGAAEDVALAPNGDLYVIYNGIDAGLYRIPAGSDSIEPLHVGDPLLVDPQAILLTPFRGF